MKYTIYIVLSLTLLLSACVPQEVTPTVDVAAQIEASAVAMSGTMIAETQAAIPPSPTSTDTPVPSPTSLPTATETPVPLSPIVVDFSPTSASTDPCDGPLLANPAFADAGKTDRKANIQIQNSTKVSVTASLYLSKNDFGQCGFVSYVLAPKQSVTVSGQLPYGCYFASAYVNDPKKPSRPDGASACITGDDRTTVTIYADKITIVGP